VLVLVLVLVLVMMQLCHKCSRKRQRSKVASHYSTVVRYPFFRCLESPD
jgi:ABC-type arginine transport system permease subunit